MGNHKGIFYRWPFLRHPVTEHREKDRCHLSVAVLEQLGVKALEGEGEGWRELAPRAPVHALQIG